jgi:hypothetical protein
MKRVAFLTVFLIGFYGIYSLVNFVDKPSLALASSGVQYTFNGYGMQTLTYNGQSFINNPPEDNAYTQFFTFQTPSGQQHSFAYDSGEPVIISTSSSPDTIQQIYNSGLSDSYTIKYQFSTPDSQTLKTDIYVTNNDATDTIESFNLEYNLNLLMPGYTPFNQYWYGAGANIGIGDVSLGENYYSGGPVTFLAGQATGTTPSWGSLAMYSDDYTKNWTFGSATTNNDQNGPWFLMNFANHGSNGGSLSNTLSDPILPGQTHHYDYYIRFGSSTDTATSLAPQAYSTWRTDYPDLVNWPDRAPIARWFLTNGVSDSILNPRGYLGDPTLDVSNQTNFDARIMAAASNTIATMNAMNPRPQALLIWDLEGQEFYQPFTYVGYPNRLPLIAPEMNSVADQLISTIQAAGYQVGLTLRPSVFGAGPALPATCYHDDNNGGADSDIYVLTTAPYQYRGYECTATNTWTQSGANLPAHQTGSDLDSIFLSNLESKVSYAENRWGIHMFYVDSTVYGDVGTGFSYFVWRQLETAFPNDLFIPEEPGGAANWGATSAYSSPGDILGGLSTPQAALDMYPGAFSAVEAENIDLSGDATGVADYNALVQSVSAGNPLFVDGWFDNEPADGQILGIYRTDGFSNPTSTPFIASAAATSVTTSAATINAVMVSTGSSSIIQSGFAYGTSPTLTTGVSTSTLGSKGTGSFSQNISGLTPNTIYYFDAYASNSQGTSAGQALSFLTLPLPPTVTTQSPTADSGSVFVGNGTITSLNGVNASDEGFVYGTTTSYGATTTNVGPFDTGFFGTGAFTSSITNLSCNTLYYTAAYVTTTGGTAYGSPQTITTGTCVAPSINATPTASSITTTSAILNGDMTSDGNASSTIEGFNWGTDATYGQRAQSSGTFGMGAFSQTLSNLTCGTAYHYQAFAVNFAGEGTSSDQSFSTSACPSSGGGGGSSGGGSADYSSGGGGGGGGGSYVPLASTSATSTCTTTPATVQPLSVVTLSLVQGSTGTAVTNLQTYLAIMGYLPSKDVTGYYGSLTKAAVVKYIVASTPVTVCPVTATTIASTSTIVTTTSATTSIIPVSLLDLAYGSTGPSVISLQDSLIVYGYLASGLNTGYYGNLTKAAVVKYLSATSGSGISIPPFTRTLTLGSVGQDVKYLQIFLNDHDFTIALSGNGSSGHESNYFGPATKAALIRFQNKYATAILTPYGLMQGTGVFGTETRKEVNSLLF